MSGVEAERGSVRGSDPGASANLPRSASTRKPDYVQVIRVDGPEQQWRWRVRAANHRIIATSGESYTSQAHCLRMVARLFPGLGVRVP